MPRPLVSEIRAEVYVYPTEDEETILNALSWLFSGHEVQISEKKLKSHHGYPIKLVEYRTSGQGASEVFSRLLHLLGDRGREEVRGTLGSRVNRRDLYLRIDKQKLVGGELDVNPDPVGGQVRIVVRFRSRRVPDELGEWLAEFHRPKTGSI